MRLWFSLLISCFVLGSISMPAAAVEMNDPLTAGFHLTFEEEFDLLDASETSGSGARWYTRTPWGGDFGEAQFAGALNNGTFSTNGGVLTITLQQKQKGHWTAGLLSSMDPKGNGFSQQYGYFEMRARLPEGRGVWPAFWLIGVDRLSPDTKVTAEIDVMEHYGAIPAAFSSKWHVWYRDGSGRHDWDYQRQTVEEGQLSEQFHRFGVLITEDAITFYFEGNAHWSVPTPKTHKQPMIVLANLTAGGGWPVTDEADGAQMHIDYIRVYERKYR